MSIRRYVLAVLIVLVIGSVLFWNYDHNLAVRDSFDSGFPNERKQEYQTSQIYNGICLSNKAPSYSVYDAKASDSVQLEVYITLAEVNSLVDAEFTTTVWIRNIVKMKGFSIDIYWNAYLHNRDPCPGINGTLYTTLLTTDPSKVIINDALFPSANCTPTIAVTGMNGTAPRCGWINFDWWGHVHVDDALPSGWPLINATYPPRSLWLFNVTFTKCDPWYCGAQPDYQAKPSHDWSLENASTSIYFSGGTISSCCGPTPMSIGTDIPATDTTYVFAPIPGDLNGDGKVDVVDLMIEAVYYGYAGEGNPFSCYVYVPPHAPPNGWPAYYDLNNDGSIDIYDLVIVAKNFGRTTPSDP